MKEVNAAIITIGDELLIGQTIDTNSAFISQELNKIGIWVKRRVAVGDVKEEILAAFQHESKDCDIIIITGGLGPTADDITKPVLCEYFNTQLIINEEALENVKSIFSRSNRPVTERNLKQAEVPASCDVLQNARGTAPGMWFTREQKIFISLPGVPHEMKGLIANSVIPKLKKQITLPVVVHRTMLTAGIGESQIADLLVDFEQSLPPQIKLAYLPAYGMVRLRLTGRAEDKDVIVREIEPSFTALKSLMHEWIIADEDVSLQHALVKLLKEKQQTLSTAESCTGGYIAHLITSVSGSSEVFNGSVVAYANKVKENMLRVEKHVLQSHGAVSEETVRQMLAGALQSVQSDYAIATSGIMGPSGGSDEKPVGTVWIAVGNSKNIETKKFHFRFDRNKNIELTAHTAMVMLYRFIKNGNKS